MCGTSPALLVSCSFEVNTGTKGSPEMVTVGSETLPAEGSVPAGSGTHT